LKAAKAQCDPFDAERACIKARLEVIGPFRAYTMLEAVDAWVEELTGDRGYFLLAAPLSHAFSQAYQWPEPLVQN
jgi:hypothetical protein